MAKEIQMNKHFIFRYFLTLGVFTLITSFYCTHSNAANFQVVMEELCGNGIDDDGDGAIDCDDSDLANDCCCISQTNVELGPDITFCEGQFLTLYGPSASSYSWFTDDQFLSSDPSLVISESGTYFLEVFDPITLCTDIDSVQVTVQATTTTNIDYTLCNGEDIIVNGTVYNQEGTYTEILQTEAGCDSIVVFNLSFGEAAEGEITQVLCPTEPLTLNGQTFELPGSYAQLLQAANGCDSLLIVHVISEVTHIESAEYEICQGDTLNLYDEIITEGGNYLLNISTDPGCDSILAAQVFMSMTGSGTTDLVICEGESIEVNGQTFDEAGQYMQTLPGGNGCDSVLTINLAILPTGSGSTDLFFCMGDTISVNGESFFQAGQFQQTLTGTNGCDSLLTINLNMGLPTSGVLDVAICDGTSIDLNGESFTDPGSYMQILQNSAGCDSLLTINVSEGLDHQETIEASICEGEIFEFAGEIIMDAGVYLQSLQTDIGCDSTVILELTVEDGPTTNITEVIATGESFVWNGNELTESGVYEESFTAANGCDSLVTLTLVVSEAIVHYDFNDCNATINDGSNQDYSEFTPNYPNSLSCSQVSASAIGRSNPVTNLHSCTPGANDTPAICVSSVDACEFQAEDEKSIFFEVAIQPTDGESVRLAGLSFLERAPEFFEWINGPGGGNNYPTLYALRILVDGAEVFLETDIPTNLEWTEQTFNLMDVAELNITSNAVVRFEFQAYCLVGELSLVTAWDLEDIQITAACMNIPTQNRMLAGIIETEAGERISDVEISLINEGNTRSTQSDEQGVYFFEDCVSDIEYHLDCQKNGDDLNGVTTSDIIAIQRHILQIKELDSPYKMIAADVNNNKEISAIDLVEIRKLILGVYTEFPENDSWRFNVKAHEIPMFDPWRMEEDMSFNDMDHDVLDAHFIGIKIGDVNNTVQLGLHQNALTERSQVSQLKTKEQQLKAGQECTIKFNLDQEIPLTGFQTAFDLHDISIIDVKSSLPNFENYNFHIHNNQLKISWNHTNPIFDSETILEIRIISNIDQFASEALTMTNDDIFKSALYLGEELEEKDIELSYQSRSSESMVFQNQPNPFSEITQIPFSVSQTEAVTLTIFDQEGKLVYKQKGVYAPGMHSIQINRHELQLQTGLFWYQLDSKTLSESKSMILID